MSTCLLESSCSFAFRGCTTKVRFNIYSLFTHCNLNILQSLPRFFKNPPHRSRTRNGKTAIVNTKKKFVRRSTLSKNSQTPPFRPFYYYYFFSPAYFPEVYQGRPSKQSVVENRSFFSFFFPEKRNSFKACLLNKYNASVLKLKITANLCLCEPVLVLAEFLNKYEGFFTQARGKATEIVLAQHSWQLSTLCLRKLGRVFQLK